MPRELQQAANEGVAHTQSFLDQWSAYIDIAKGGNTRAATGLVCSMLREIESADPASAYDAPRLWPLAMWIERFLPDIHNSFVELER